MRSTRKDNCSHLERQTLGTKRTSELLRCCVAETLEQRTLLANDLNLTQVSSDLQQGLTTIDGYVHQAAAANQLPVIGPQIGKILGSTSNGIAEIDNAISTINSDLTALQNYSSTDVATAQAELSSVLDSAFGSSAVALGAQPTGGVDYKINYPIFAAQPYNFSTSFNLGFSSLGLSVAGNVGFSAALTGTLQMEFGVDSQGFFFRNAPNVALKAVVKLKDANGPDTISGTLLSLFQLNATDNGSALTADFIAQLGTPQTMYRASDLTNLSPSLTLGATGDGLNFNVNATLGIHSAELPALGVNLMINWPFPAQGLTLSTSTGFSFKQLDAPTVTYNKISMNLGDFISNMVNGSGITKELARLTAPFQPLINFIKAPIPVVSDSKLLRNGGEFAGFGIPKLADAQNPNQISLQSISEELYPQYASLAKSLDNLNTLIQTMKGLSYSGSAMLPLGSFTIGSSDPNDPNNNLLNATSLDNLTSDVSDAWNTVSQMTSQLSSDAAGVVNDLDTALDDYDSDPTSSSPASGLMASDPTFKVGLTFPIFQNLTSATGVANTVFKLLTGQNAKLVQLNLSFNNVGGTFSEFYPIYAGFGIQINGSAQPYGSASSGNNTGLFPATSGSLPADTLLNFSGNLTVGYDTTGLKEFAGGDFSDPTQLLNGFYITALSSNQASYLELDTGLAGNAVYNIPSLDIGAGLNMVGDVKLGFNTTSNDTDGNVRWSDIDQLTDGGTNPFGLITADGKVTLNADIYAKIGFNVPGLGFEGLDKEINLASVTLVDFTLGQHGSTSQGGAPVLAKVTYPQFTNTDGTLTLTDNKNGLNATSGFNGNIDLTVDHISTNADGTENVTVSEPDVLPQTFDNISAIYGQGAGGQNVINIGPGVTSSLTLYAGDDPNNDPNYAADKGYEGPDTINDQGSGQFKIYGSYAGNDTITVLSNIGNGASFWGGTIFGGSGNDTITANGGDGLIQGTYQNNVTIIAGSGNNQITGGSQNETILGGSGDDTINGGGGGGLIEGGGGNNQITIPASPISLSVYGDAPGTTPAPGVANSLQFEADGTDTLTLQPTGDATGVQIVRPTGQLDIGRNMINEILNGYQFEALDVESGLGTNTLNLYSLVGTGVTQLNVNSADTKQAAERGNTTVHIYGGSNSSSVTFTSQGTYFQTKVNGTLVNSVEGAALTVSGLWASSMGISIADNPGDNVEFECDDSNRNFYNHNFFINNSGANGTISIDSGTDLTDTAQDDINVIQNAGTLYVHQNGHSDYVTLGYTNAAMGYITPVLTADGNTIIDGQVMKTIGSLTVPPTYYGFTSIIANDAGDTSGIGVYNLSNLGLSVALEGTPTTFTYVLSDDHANSITLDMATFTGPGIIYGTTANVLNGKTTIGQMPPAVTAIEVNGTAKADTISAAGSAYGVLFYGNGGKDTLTGGNGNDTFNVTPSINQELIDGGPGVNILSYNVGATTPVQALMVQASTTVSGALALIDSVGETDASRLQHLVLDGGSSAYRFTSISLVGTPVNYLEIDSGAVADLSATAIPNTVSVLVGFASTFDLNGYDASIGSLQGVGSVTLGAATLSTGGDNSNTTFGGVISGSGSLVKVGIGTFTLSASQAYTGSTAVNAGTLQDGIANALPATTDLTIAAGAPGGNYNLADFSQAVGSLSGAGSVNLGTGTLTTGGDGASTIYSGTISGAGGVTKTGPGIWTVNGSNSYTGATTLTFGTLTFNSLAALGNGGALSFTRGILQYATGTTVDISALNIIIASRMASIDTNGNNVTFANPFAAGSAGGLTKLGLGTLTLTASNNYTGSTNVSGGTIVAGDGATHGSIAGNIVLAGGTFVFNRSDNITFTGTTTGNGALEQIGTNALSITSPVHTGSTFVQNGTLQLLNNNALNLMPSAVTVSYGATFDANNLAVTIGSLSGAGNVLDGSGSLSTGTDNTNTAFSGIISGSGSVTKIGGGTWTVTGNNTYTGPSLINGGTEIFNAIAGLGGGTAITISGGTLEYSAGNTTDISLRTVTFGANGATIDTNGNNVSYANSVGNTGAGTFTKAGAGILALNVTGTWTGGVTTISGGILRAGVVNVLPASTSLNVLSGATFDFNGFNQSIGSLSGPAGSAVTMRSGNLTAGSNNVSATFSGVISGTGSLTYASSGAVFTLSGSNTYSGGTYIGGSGGGVSVSSDANLGASTGIVRYLYTAGGYSIGSLFTTGSFATNRSIQLAVWSDGGFPDSINVAAGTTLTVNGVLSNSISTAGSPVLVKAGGGTLLLNAANTWGGDNGQTDLLIIGGTVQLGVANALPNLVVGFANNTVPETLDLNGFSQRIEGLAGGSIGSVISNSATAVTLTIDGNYPYDYDGSILGQNLSLLVSGGNQQLGSYAAATASNYGGGTTVISGLLEVGGAASRSGSTITTGPLGTGAVTLGGAGSTGAILKVIGTTLYNPVNAVAGNTGADVLNGGSYAGDVQNAVIASNVTLNHDLFIIGNETIAGVISGTGNVGFDNAPIGSNNAGTTILTAQNTYTGNTTAGPDALIQMGISNALPVNTALTIQLGYSGYGVNLNNFNTTVGSIAEASGGSPTQGFLQLGTATLTTGGDNTNTTFYGSTSGAGTIIKTGTGTWTLGGANTSTGPIDVNGGMVVIGDGTTNGAFAGNIVLGGGTVAFNRSDSITYTGSVTGTGILSQIGAGALTMPAPGHSGSTVIQVGTLRLGTAGTIPSAINISSAAVLDLNSLNISIGSLAGQGNVLLGSATLTVGTDNTNTEFDGVISGNGGLTKVGGATLTIGNGQTYTGATNISAGTLTLATPQSATLPSPAVLYTFNDPHDTSTTVTNDGTAANKNGTLVSVTEVSGVIGAPGGGKVLQLNNLHGEVLVNQTSGTGFDLSGGVWTASLWFDNLYSTATWRTVFQSTSGSSAAATIQAGGYTLGNYISGFHGTSYQVNGTPNVTTGWHQLTAVGSGGNTTFYMDGAQVAVLASEANADIYSIANYWGDDNEALATYITDVGLYKTALSPSQVALLYSQQAGIPITGALASQNVAVAAGAALNVADSTGLNSSTALTVNGTATFSSNPGSSILARTIGALSIGATGVVAMAAASNHLYRTDLVVGSLNFAGSAQGGWEGKLDLGNSDLDVQNGNLTNINSELTQGNHGGLWNGTAGIISSAAASNSSHLTALGGIQNSVDGTTTGAPLYGTAAVLGQFDGTNPANTDVLIKYTYLGDTNLDGQVDGSDYTRIDFGFLQHATGWFNGNFNYDSAVDGSDYTLIDNAFNTQGLNLATAASRIATAVPTETSTIETRRVARPVGTTVPRPAIPNVLIASVSKNPFGDSIISDRSVMQTIDDDTLAKKQELDKFLVRFL